MSTLYTTQFYKIWGIFPKSVSLVQEKQASNKDTSHLQIVDRLVDRLGQRLPCKHEDLGVDGDPTPMKRPSAGLVHPCYHCRGMADSLISGAHWPATLTALKWKTTEEDSLIHL